MRIICITLLWLCVLDLSIRVEYMEAVEKQVEKGPAKVVMWYGKNQRVATPGVAGRWVNVLGSVDPYIPGIRGYYRLNDGKMHTLFFGPDGRRRWGKGDFIVEIDHSLLKPAVNRLEIVVNVPGQATLHELVKLYSTPRSWPLPYRVDWHGKNGLGETVHVVDGLWRVKDNTLENVDIGYDRAVALGDGSWKSYEAEVICSLEKVDAEAYRSRESLLPGFGIIQGWRGHTSTPVKCKGVHCGWQPLGALYFFAIPEEGAAGWNLNTAPNSDLDVEQIFPFDMGRQYRIKARVEYGLFSRLYRLKVWEAQKPEPENWLLREAAGRRNTSGGMLLFAHHTRVAVESVDIRPLTVGVLPRSAIFVACTIATLIIGILPVFSRAERKGLPRVQRSLTAVFIMLLLVEPVLPEVLATLHFNETGARLLYSTYDIFLWGSAMMIWWNAGRVVFQKPKVV